MKVFMNGLGVMNVFLNDVTSLNLYIIRYNDYISFLHRSNSLACGCTVPQQKVEIRRTVGQCAGYTSTDTERG